MKMVCMNGVRIIIWITYVVLPIYLVLAHLQIDYRVLDDFGVSFLSDFMKLTYVPLVCTFLILVIIFTLFIFLGFVKRKKQNKLPENMI